MGGRTINWRWFLEPNLLFSVQSCYRFLIRCRVAHDIVIPVDICSALWRTAVPSKITIFGWRLFSKSIPTREILLNRHVIGSDEVAVCIFL